MCGRKYVDYLRFRYYFVCCRLYQWSLCYICFYSDPELSTTILTTDESLIITGSYYLDTLGQSFLSNRDFPIDI